MTTHGHTRCSTTPMTPSPITGTVPVVMAVRCSGATTVHRRQRGNAIGYRSADRYPDMPMRHSRSPFRVAGPGAECLPAMWCESGHRRIVDPRGGRTDDDVGGMASWLQGDGRAVAGRLLWNRVWAHPWPGATAGGTRRGWEW